MIVVHHLEHSRSQRVLWLLEELGLPYEVKRYARDRKTLLAPPELAQVHPLGKSPVITDGPTVVAESGAIMEYLCEKAGGRLRPPPGTPEARRWTYWMHFAEGSAMPPLLFKLVFDKIRSATPLLVRPIASAIAGQVEKGFYGPNIRRHLEFMEAELKERDWFAGADFSAADIQLSFPLEAAQARAGLDQRYPKLQSWLQRSHARPAYARALERGGPYQVID